MELTFKFFEDQSGRLRAKLYLNGIYLMTKPVEKADKSKRYNIAKVFALWNFGVTKVDPLTYAKLLSAKPGDKITCKVINGYLISSL